MQPKKAISLLLLISTLSLLFVQASPVLAANAAPAALWQEGEGGERLTLVISAVIGLLLIASLVGIAARQLRLPYTVGLVLIGLALTLQGETNVSVSPEIFLSLLVPPLIFEAAFHIKARDLVADLLPILAFAIPGVLITTFLVGGVVATGTGFPLATALVFGALVAATDPVAVVALFRKLGVPKRLLVLLEGESLLNDGTAIVIFNLMLAIALTGVFDPIGSVFDFLTVAGGGLVIGLVLGALISRIITLIDDPLIETTLTTVLAFGAYIAAEHFHVSGVLSVVAAGLVSGNIGPRGMSPSTRILVFNFWEYAAFLANSVAFLLIGLQINVQLLLNEWQVILWAILAVLVARAVTVYGLSWIGRGIPLSFKHVLYWGGLRGAISLALAFSLPEALTGSEDIQAMAFGVVLFTLLVQGLTMQPLINRLRLIERSEAEEEFERRHARAVMARAAHRRLEHMYREGLITRHLWERLARPLELHADALARASERILHANPQLEIRELESTFRDILLTQRSALTALLRDGIIAEETYAQLVGEVDAALLEPRSNLLETLRLGTGDQIQRLLTVIVQEEDAENVLAAFARLGIPVTRLSSIGGFSQRRNVTLLAGIPPNMREEIIETLARVSHSRVEIAQNGSTPITIGGATVFAFNVERYEVL